MRAWQIAVSLSVGLGLVAEAQGTQPPDSEGYPVMAFYAAARTPQLRPWSDWIMRNRPLDGVVETLSARYALPTGLPVVYLECGNANAYYSPGDTLVKMCYELAELFGKFYAGTQGAEAAVRNSLEFMFYHEFGHALAHLLSLPLTGREEDAVDQLAAYLLLSGGDNESVSKVWQAAITFHAFAARRGPVTARLLADEHSLDDQRYYSLLCYIAGSRPDVYTAAAIKAGLTPERARRCPREFEQLSSAWERLLEPVLRPVAYEPLSAHAYVRVFDGEDATRAANDEFNQRTLIGVGLQLRFVMPPQEEAPAKRALVTCRVLDDEDKAIGQAILDMTPKRLDWVNEVSATRIGYRQPGHWVAGDYFVECSADGKTVATSAFTVK